MPNARTFCCAKNCYNYQPSSNCPTFFNLPCDLESRLKWVTNAGRLDLKDKPFSLCTGKYHLCADHFEQQCFIDPDKKTALRRDADVVPTIFESNLSSLITIGHEKSLDDSQDSLTSAVIEQVVSAQDMLDSTVVPDDVLDSTQWPNIVAVSLGVDGNLICESSGPGSEGNSIGLVASSGSDADTLVMECLMLCRLCASLVQLSQLIPVFGEDADASLQEMIERLVPGQVVADDGLPQRVCTSCVARVRSCCEILDLFKAANDRLKQMVELCNLQENAMEENETVMVESVSEAGVSASASVLVGSVNVSEEAVAQNFVGADKQNDAITSGGLVRMYMKENSVALNKRMPTVNAGDSGISLRYDTSTTENKIVNDDLLQYSCVACQDVFTAQADVLIHLTDNHSESVFSPEVASESFQCTICEDVVSTANCLRTHMITHVANIYACKDCGMKFKVKVKLKAHIREQHTSETKEPKQLPIVGCHKCDDCGKEFRKPSSLNKHKLTHTGKTTVLCSLCGKTLANLNSLRVHMRVHSEDRPYSCAHCGKSFKGPSELRSHAITHSREKLFNCPECGRKFHSKGLVRQHLLSHTQDKPHKCDMCPAAFNRLGNLNQHRKKHSDKTPPLPSTPYECTMCGKRFQSKLTLKYHIARHTGDKYPFDCEVCGKKFIAIDPYRVHMRIHTGERPFECSVCKKTFRSSATLKQHTASLHRDDFPFACPYCQRSFKRLQSLVVHKKTHTGEKPWLCSQCGRAFSQKGDMLKHAKTHRPHREEEAIIMEVDSIDDLGLDTEISKMIFG